MSRTPSTYAKDTGYRVKRDGCDRFGYPLLNAEQIENGRSPKANRVNGNLPKSQRRKGYRDE